MAGGLKQSINHMKVDLQPTSYKLANSTVEMQCLVSSLKYIKRFLVVPPLHQDVQKRTIQPITLTPISITEPLE